MKSRSRSVTVLIQKDGRTKTKSYRIKLWTLRLAAWLLALVAVLMLLLVVLYGPTLRAAARVPGMERELTRLQAENASEIIVGVVADTEEAAAAPPGSDSHISAQSFSQRVLDSPDLARGHLLLRPWAWAIRRCDRGRSRW